MEIGERREKKEREANHERWFTIESKLKVAGGEWVGWVKWVVEGTCDEQWVSYVSDKSLNSAPETNIALHINQDLSRNLKQSKQKWSTVINNRIIKFNSMLPRRNRAMLPYIP